MIYKLKNKITIIPIFILLFCSCSNSNVRDKNILYITGSTSVASIVSKLATAFEKENNEYTVLIDNLTSSIGIRDTIEGYNDIGMSSRDLKDEELEELEGIVIAIDGIVIIVNSENTVTDLSLDDALKIYTGEITNWSELGGADEEIAVISREEGSGTRDGFQSVVGFESEEQVESASIQSSTGAVVSLVSSSTNAIGYISLGSLSDEVTAATIDGVVAGEDTISDGSYALQRPFNLAILIGYEGADSLIEYIFSDEGAAIISDSGYIPTTLED